MQDIIKITKQEIGTQKVNSVNASDIHKHLQIRTKFSDWISRAIEKYDFEDDIDFSILRSRNPNGGIKKIDVIVTLDMAKELAMLSNTPKGKEVRKYFIEVEKKSKEEELTLHPQAYNSLLEISYQMAIFHQAINQIGILARQRENYIKHHIDTFIKYYPKTKEYFESLEKRDLVSSYF